MEKNKSQGSVNNYTNQMRLAIRTLKNPSPIPVYIVQQKDGIEIRVDHKGVFDRMTPANRLNFISYLKDVTDIIESEGSVAYVTGIKI